MARIFIGSIAPNIHGITGTEEIENDDELILYDNSSSANRKTKLSDFIAGIKAKITSIPYVCDYDSLYESSFAKISAAYDEGRPVVLNYKGNTLQLISCSASSAEFYGFKMLPNPEIGYVCIRPYYAEINSDGTRTITESKSYSPIPGVLTVKLTEKDGTISADKGTDDFAFVHIYNVPIEVEYNGLHYYMNAASSESGRKFYAIAADEGNNAIHELTLKNSIWSHRTLAVTGTSGGSGGYTPIKGVDYWTEADKAEIVEETKEAIDIPTKTSQLENDSGFIDDSNTEETSVLALSKVATTGRYADLLGLPTIPTVPSKVSGFTNDAGYLTLATLPKYEGAVE